MPDRLRAALVVLTSEVAERYLGRLLVDAAAIYRVRRNRVEVEAWLERQDLDQGRKRGHH